ncbi:MAG: hypothetical protein GC161_15320 [Planctomycetaceae bacterium]|nr:hypothetical protein [Planctomycetaceae bacterium]
MDSHDSPVRGGASDRSCMAGRAIRALAFAFALLFVAVSAGGDGHSSQGERRQELPVESNGVSFDVLGVEHFPKRYFGLALREAGTSGAEIRALDGRLPCGALICGQLVRKDEFHLKHLAPGDYEVVLLTPSELRFPLGTVTVGLDSGRSHDFQPDFGPLERRVEAIVPGSPDSTDFAVRTWADGKPSSQWLHVDPTWGPTGRGPPGSGNHLRLLALPGSVLEVELSLPGCAPARFGFDAPSMTSYLSLAPTVQVELDVLPVFPKRFRTPPKVAIVSSEMINNQRTDYVLPLLHGNWVRRESERHWATSAIGPPPYSAVWLTGVRDESVVVLPVPPNRTGSAVLHLTLPDCLR